MKKLNPKTDPKIIAAMSDPNLLRYGVVEAMKKFNLSYPRAKTVLRDAFRKKLQDKETEKINQILEDKDADRIFRSMVHAERNHPHLYRNIFSGRRNMARTGRTYNITREAVRQFKNSFISYSHLRNILPRNLLQDIEQQAST